MVLRASTDLINADEFEQMPEFHQRYELTAGRLVEKPLPKFAHGSICKKIIHQLVRFDPEEKLGELLPEVNVRITDKSTLTPDLSFWVAERVPAFEIVTAPYPDLAIEVQSPDQSLGDLTDKAKDYISAGTRLVWIIQPNKRIAAAIKPNSLIETIQPNGILDAGDIIPGFKIILATLFG